MDDEDDTSPLLGRRNSAIRVLAGGEAHRFRLSFRSKLLYAAPHAALCCARSFVELNLAKTYIDGAGLSPLHVAFMSTFLRTVDLYLSPAFGWLLDNVRVRRSERSASMGHVGTHTATHCSTRSTTRAHAHTATCTHTPSVAARSHPSH